MSRILSRPPSAAMLLALVALFIALGGTAIAATFISSNKQVGNDTINSRNVVDNSLTGLDVSEETFGQVPSAATAGSAAIRGYEIVKSLAILNPASTTTTGTVACPVGKKVLGGGAIALGLRGQSINGSFPASATKWQVEMINSSSVASNFVVFATCANAQ
jgi:hypothetical protein